MKISIEQYCVFYNIPYNKFSNLTREQSINLINVIVNQMNILRIEKYDNNLINFNHCLLISLGINNDSFNNDTIRINKVNTV